VGESGQFSSTTPFEASIWVVAVAGWGLGGENRPWRQRLGVASIGERRKKSNYVQRFSGGPRCSPMS
jgi:hypothetical protein